MLELLLLSSHGRDGKGEEWSPELSDVHRKGDGTPRTNPRGPPLQRGYPAGRPAPDNDTLEEGIIPLLLPVYMSQIPKSHALQAAAAATATAKLVMLTIPIANRDPPEQREQAHQNNASNLNATAQSRALNQLSTPAEKTPARKALGFLPCVLSYRVALVGILAPKMKVRSRLKSKKKKIETVNSKEREEQRQGGLSLRFRARL